MLNFRCNPHDPAFRTSWKNILLHSPITVRSSIQAVATIRDAPLNFRGSTCRIAPPCAPLSRRTRQPCYAASPMQLKKFSLQPNNAGEQHLPLSRHSWEFIGEDSACRTEVDRSSHMTFNRRNFVQGATCLAAAPARHCKLPSSLPVSAIERARCC